MARVFRGKIAIPGDQMEAYFEALGQFENAKAPMRTQLEQCAGDFARALAGRVLDVEMTRLDNQWC